MSALIIQLKCKCNIRQRQSQHKIDVEENLENLFNETIFENTRRSITSPPIERSINIMAGKTFITDKRVVTDKCKIYTVRGNPKPKHKPQISEKDLKNLGSYFLSFNTDKRKRQQCLIWPLLILWKTRQRRLRAKNSFVLKTDENNNGYLPVSEGITKKTNTRLAQRSQNDQ